VYNTMCTAHPFLQTNYCGPSGLCPHVDTLNCHSPTTTVAMVTIVGVEPRHGTLAAQGDDIVGIKIYGSKACKK